MLSVSDLPNRRGRKKSSTLSSKDSSTDIVICAIKVGQLRISDELAKVAPAMLGKGSKIGLVEHHCGLSVSVTKWSDLHNAALLLGRFLRCETEREIKQLRNVSSK